MNYNAELRKILRPRYRKLPGKLCFYCGEPATCHDHVPPVSCMTEKSGLLIPACHECNAHLHTYPFRNLSDRRNLLLKKYKRKYRALLNNRKKLDDELETEKRRLKRRFTLLKSRFKRRKL